jgi:hypothetical protein
MAATMPPTLYSVRLVHAGVMTLGAALYLIMIVIVIANPPEDVQTIQAFWIAVAVAIVVWNALLLTVTVMVIIDSIRKVRAGRTRELTADLFIVKLASIPFFLLNFAAIAVIAFTGLALFVVGGAVFFVVVAIAAGLTYTTMLSTSVYGWAAIAGLRQERHVDAGRLTLYAVLLFVFVADVVASILLFTQFGRDRVAKTEVERAALRG